MEASMEKAANKKPYHALRFERKFIYEHVLLEDLIRTEIETHPFAFKEIYERRSVNNIYFDDLDMNFYKQNVSGDGLREKYRLRWYGNTFSEIKNPTLEIKKKYGEVGDKFSFKLKGFETSLKSNSTYEIKNWVVDQAINAGEIALATNLKNITPALLNTYERRYFLSHCGKYRITLDYNMAFMSPQATNFEASRITAKDICLELKYNTKHDTESREVSQYLSARLSKNSKYVRGIDTFYRS